MSKISKEKMERTEAWHKKAFALLVDQKITTVIWRKWDEDSESGLVLILDNGAALFISQDDEGNGPGAIHWSTGKDTSTKVYLHGDETVMIEPHGVLPVGVLETAVWREAEMEATNNNYEEEVEANKKMIADKVNEINDLANKVEGDTNG